MITILTADLHPPIAQTTSLRGSLKKLWLREEARQFPVLTNIDLELVPGTRLGLLGPNGAGKSSLLRLMAGIFEPTRGVVMRSGKIVTLFDLHFGMDDEASGYQNLEIGGALLGISRREISNLIAEIAEFSDLGEALHRPIKSYSAGMRVRLAFSLVTSLQADCLLIDEIIGVGDASFLKKARRRLEQQMKRSNIVVIASHANSVLSDFCTTGIVLEHGRITFRGAIDDAIEHYSRSVV